MFAKTSESFVSFSRSKRPSKACLVGGSVKWSSLWEFLYRSLAYTVTMEVFLTNHKTGIWNDESSCIQLILAYIFVGVPLYYTQMVIGQYAQMGVMCYRNILPIARGLSYTILICIFLQTLAFGIWLGDSMLYFLTSMQLELPWMHCPGNESQLHNITCFDDKNPNVCNGTCVGGYIFTSSRYYHLITFLGHMVREDEETVFPPINRIVALCVAWVLVFLFVHNVFMKYKKILMVQMLSSCALILLLCTGTISASGGKPGIAYLFEDLWRALTFKRTWTRALSSVIRGLCLGEAFAMTSGAKFTTKQNITLMVMFFAVAKGFVNTFASMFYQSVIGMIAFRTGTRLHDSEVLEVPFDFLAYFITIPQGLGYLTVPQVWSMLYFSLCITILLMNTISRIVILSAVTADAHSFVLKYSKYLLACYCMVSMIIGFLMIGKKHYVFSCYFMNSTITLLQDFNIAYMSLMIYYVYGVTKLSDDIHFLTGTPPTKFWKLSWYCLPIIMAYTFHEEYIYYLREQNPIVNEKIITLSLLICILPIPIFWVVESIGHIKARHLTGMITSTELWGPADPEERHRRRSFNPRLQTKYHSRMTACNHHCLIRYKGVRILHQEESRCRESYLAEFEGRTIVKKKERRERVRRTIALDILDETKI